MSTSASAAARERRKRVLFAGTMVCAVGAAALSYGMRRSSLDLPWLPGEAEALVERLEAGRALSADVMRAVCERLGVAQDG